MEENNQQSSVEQQPQQPVVQPSQQTTTPSTPPKSKLPLFIIAFIILIIIGGGGYFLNPNLESSSFVKTSEDKQNLKPTQATTISPTSTTYPTANWKNITYNHLTFKIPPVYQSGYLGSSSAFAIDPQPIPQTSPYGDFTPAFALNLIKNKTIDQVKQEFLNQLGYTNKEISNITIDTVSGLKTTEILPPGEDAKDHHVYDVYLPIGQDLYRFSSFDLHISTADQQKYFDQILSTFKFTQ